MHNINLRGIMKNKTKSLYIEIPFEFVKKTGDRSKVCFFIPKSFVKNGEIKNISLSPTNFLGVNLKILLDSIDES